jgi:CheY-like chemotaxis protein
MSRVLILDDDASLRHVVSDYLQGHGHSVCSSDNAAVALRELQTGTVDIAIIDLFLPGSDGLDFIERGKSACQTLKVLAISGGSKIDKDACLRCAKTVGADATLAKPFSLEQLGSAIAGLGSPQLR